ncbi:MAG: c-type cytochrome biogenesis protein CcmI, partial [Gammaproteobacteria bacterium]|nr:c-type cytochrome biogenesis protein CcmI [Gammaproteobacteria bacterium]
MSTFLIASGVLSLIAMAFVVTPLLRVRDARNVDRRAANVALYRERLAELDAARAGG